MTAHDDDPAASTAPAAADPAGAPQDPRTRVGRPPGAAMRFDDTEPATLVLVRHGVTPYTLTGAYSGGSVPGPALTGHGRIQAAKAADLVNRIGRQLWQDLPRPRDVVASPMVRTQETAAAVGRRLGYSVRTEPLLAECDFGDWEGLTPAQVEERWPGELRRWHETGESRPPGGESISEVGARVEQALAAIADRAVGRTTVVVSHAVAVRSAIGTAAGAPVSQWHRIRIPPASVSILRRWPDGTSEISAVGIPCEI